jgi:signal peptidase II
MKSTRQKVADWWSAARVNPLFWRGVTAALAVVAIDQASKFWVVNLLRLPERHVACAKNPGEVCQQIALSPIFDLTYVENRGASFGILAGGLPSRIILSLISISVSLVLIAWLGRLTRPLAAAAAALIVGGALGNLYDRLAYGYVVDFLDFSGLFFPWVFNVADASINVGIGLLLVDALLTREKKGGATSPKEG